MRRRKFLVATAAASIGLTGCLDGDNEEEQEENNGPEAVVRQFVEALDRGDADGVNSLIHPDGQVPPLSEQDAQEFSQADWTVEETEVLEQDDEVAIVRSSITVGAPVPDAGEQTQEMEWELRTSNGEWLVWDGGPGTPGGAA